MQMDGNETGTGGGIDFRNPACHSGAEINPMSHPQEKPQDPPGDEPVMNSTVRGDLLRANTSVAIVLMAVLALALVAIFGGLRAARNRERAEAAEADSRERLQTAYTEQARAIRVSGEAGSRAAAIAVISNAVAIHPSPELRTEAIACLALSDLVQEGPLVPTPKDLPRVEMDSRLRYFAYGTSAGNVLIHSLADGSESFLLTAAALGSPPRGPVGELSFSPDGRLLAARFSSGAAVVWNLDSRQPVFATGLAETNTKPLLPLNGLMFSADSRRLIFSDRETQGRISVADLATGQTVPSPVAVGGKVFRLRPDLMQVAVVTDTSVDILEYPAGTTNQTVRHPAHVDMIEWSPDGKRLAVSCDNGDVDLWDPEHNVERLFAGHSERCLRLNFSPDGTLLFSSSRDGTTRLWDTTLCRLIAVGAGMGHIFSPDGHRIGFWRPWDGFGVWRISPSTLYSIHACDKNEGPLVSIDLSADGRWCVGTQSKGIRLWDLAAADRETYVPGTFTGARVAMDGRSLFVCRDSGLEVWPLATNAAGGLELPPAAPRIISVPGQAGAHAVALSGDGRWVLVDLPDQRLVRMDLTGVANPVVIQGRWRAPNLLKGPASPTGTGRYALSPDGQWVATGFGFAGDTPKVWNANSGELAMALPADTSVVGFSPDGRWLGLAGMNVNSIWSTGGWKLQKLISRDDASLVHGALAFVGGGLIAASRTRQTVQLYDWQAGEKICDLVAPLAQSVNSLRVSADGSTVVMATASDMVEVWRLGELRQALAAMKLDWGMPLPAAGTVPPAGRYGAGSWQVAVIISLGGFTLITVLALLTLRRHRRAIERFVIAEAKAARRNRELDRAKVELMHSHKMQALGTLATGIAHDFNNLLSVVRMSNKLIGRQAPGDPEIQENVADIEQAVLQGKNVVRAVLGYGRTGQESDAPAEAGRVVEETVALLSREFLSGITLSSELEPNAPKVALGRGLLEQILLNLVVNASEALRGEGRLKIVLRSLPAEAFRALVLRPRAAEHYLELVVTDSGPGISPEIRDRIFEPFFTTKRGGTKPGTGLGLSLVYSIAQSAGLGLGVESELGRGTVFTVLLPVAADPVRESHSGGTANPV